LKYRLLPFEKKDLTHTLEGRKEGEKGGRLFKKFWGKATFNSKVSSSSKKERCGLRKGGKKKEKRGLCPLHKEGGVVQKSPKEYSPV